MTAATLCLIYANIPVILFPIILTIFFLGMMFRPYHEKGMFDFGAIFRLFYLIPILIIWLIYFIIV